jgi:hypothetical protein
MSIPLKIEHSKPNDHLPLALAWRGIGVPRAIVAARTNTSMWWTTIFVHKRQTYSTRTARVAAAPSSSMIGKLFLGPRG